MKFKAPVLIGVLVICMLILVGCGSPNGIKEGCYRTDDGTRLIVTKDWNEYLIQVTDVTGQGNTRDLIFSGIIDDSDGEIHFKNGIYVKTESSNSLIKHYSVKGTLSHDKDIINLDCKYLKGTYHFDCELEGVKEYVSCTVGVDTGFLAMRKKPVFSDNNIKCKLEDGETVSIWPGLTYYNENENSLYAIAFSESDSKLGFVNTQYTDYQDIISEWFNYDNLNEEQNSDNNTNYEFEYDDFFKTTSVNLGGGNSTESCAYYHVTGNLIAPSDYIEHANCGTYEYYYYYDGDQLTCIYSGDMSDFYADQVAKGGLEGTIFDPDVVREETKNNNK